MKSEMSKLNSTLEEERQLAGQHLLALQAQISEAQARAKVRSAHQRPYKHLQYKTHALNVVITLF